MNYDRLLTRVFDKQEKKMFYNVYSFHDIEKNKDRLIPMMCTGLKDKNDKLIYEGDIIDYKNVSIIWNLSMAKFTTNYYEDLTDYIIEECKVIGNIWEHPELLEGKV